jgi:hypothetical protein
VVGTPGETYRGGSPGNIGTTDGNGDGYYDGDSRVSYYYAQVYPYDNLGQPQSYEVTVENTNGAALQLSVFEYDYNDFDCAGGAGYCAQYMFDPATAVGTSPSPCVGQPVASGKASCTVPGPSSWILFIAVDGYGTLGGDFKLTVKPAATALSGEGNTPGTGVPAPLELGNADVDSYGGLGYYQGAYFGHVAYTGTAASGVGGGDEGDSYYQVSVVPGSRYYVGLSNYTGPADIYVFDGNDTAAPLVCQPGSYIWDAEAYGYGYYDKWCYVQASGSTLTIGVDGSRASGYNNDVPTYYLYAYGGSGW